MPLFPPLASVISLSLDLGIRGSSSSLSELEEIAAAFSFPLGLGAIHAKGLGDLDFLCKPQQVRHGRKTH